MTREQWIILGDVGISSKTMWSAIMGVIDGGAKGWTFNTPQDPDDFSRCFKMVNECSFCSNDLQKVKDVFKWYAPFIDNWEELALLYSRKKYKPLYDRMQKLEEESMILDGWVKADSCTWTKTQGQKP
jgi:hypothetical protein